MGKIISSRPFEGTPIDALKDYVFVLHDILGRNEEPADTVDSCMAQLDSAVVDIARVHLELKESALLMSADFLRLMRIHNSTMMDLVQMSKDLASATKILLHLTAPSYDDDAMALALAVLRREGRCDASMEVDENDPSGMVLNVTAKFKEDLLDEALRCAIEVYNNEVVAKIVAAGP